MNLKQALIDNDSIRLGVTASDWKEAVKLAVEPLVESGAVKAEYYDAIIASTAQYGPYYILMPGMAMPHARPEAGVQRDAFSLITLTHPVKFQDGKEVSVLLALAATSSKIHTSVAIPQIIALFELENSVERLQSCQTKEEVLAMIDESKDSPYLEVWIFELVAAIRLGVTASDWKEAVKLAVEPLVESGAVKAEYYDAIIASTAQYGPYYILMPGMAMPHARPEAGVQRDAFSLITLTHPVKFQDGKEVSVLLALAATSSKIHTSVAIPQIIALFELENSVERLQSCQTKEEVLAMIDESKDSPYLEGLDLES